MNALEEYIDDLVNDRESQDDFPKNESSWEELYDLCGKLIAEIVTLRRKSAQHSVHPTNGGLCAECGSPQWCHSVIGHDFVPPPPAGSVSRSVLDED